MSYSASLLLALLLLWAAVAKWRSPDSTRAAVRAFGVAPVFAVVLPIVESALAIGLVIAPKPSGWLSVALLGLFTGVVIRALRTGTKVSCGCFGASDSGTVGTHTILRNVGMMTLALLAASTAAPGVPALPEFVLVTLSSLSFWLLVALVGLRSEVGSLFPSASPTLPHRRESVSS